MNERRFALLELLTEQKKIKKSYHRRAAGVDQVVEVRQHWIFADHDQEDADHLQQPVKHVEPHRDQVPTFSQNFG